MGDEGVRPILILTVSAALLVPGAAFAFDVDASAATNPDGSERYADPDEKPVIPGLQAYGIDSGDIQSTGVYIPQSPASSDLPPLLYSSLAFRYR